MNKTFKLTSQLSETPKRLEKYQLMKAGVFSYFEPGDMVISSEMFLSFVDNFNKKIRGTDLAIDYGHNALDEAAGWITALETNEDRSELWAEIKWTPKGLEALQNKEYRYISAEFTYDYEDEKGVKVGPTLFGAGLTNRPFLKNMKPLIELSEEQRKRKMDLEKKLAEMQTTLETQVATVKELTEKLAERDGEIEKLKAEKILAEKHQDFNQMLLAGKVCEAQRDAFIAGDLKAFAENAQAVKLVPVGHGDSANPDLDLNKLSSDEAEDELIKLAGELRVKEALSFAEAVLRIKKEKPELASKAALKFQ